MKEKLKFEDFSSLGKKKPKVSGIYVLCLNKKIIKLDDKDKCGILYIGKAKNLKQRLKLQKKKYNKNKDEKEFDHCNFSYILHSKEGKLELFRYELKEEYKKTKIKGKGLLKSKKSPRLVYFTCNKETETQEETRLLVGHAAKYLQLPVFNSSSIKWAVDLKKKNKYLWVNDTLEYYKNFEKKLSEFLNNNKKK